MWGMRSARVAAAGAVVGLACGLAACGDDDGSSSESAAGGGGDDIKVGLITKTETNPSS
jgi:fructose transport system substrate-binding protein